MAFLHSTYEKIVARAKDIRRADATVAAMVWCRGDILLAWSARARDEDR